MEHIEITFRMTNGRYVFASADNKILIAHSDRDEAAALFLRLFVELARKGTTCRIEAYAALGPALKLLRDAGAICRVGLQSPTPLKPTPWQLPDDQLRPAPPPQFLSWGDHLARTPLNERLAKCQRIAKKANKKRLLSEAPHHRLTAQTVWTIIEAAKGRCVHCGSLAVEDRPSSPTGAPLPWAQIGRRIGSLEHVKRRFERGDNDLPNLAWACLWCNTWPPERRPSAVDHGGHYPTD